MFKRKKKEDAEWDIVVRADRSAVSLQLNELWRYRDLLVLFVKRDIVAMYKQTVLGPLWFFLQPLLTAATLSVVFGMIAKLPVNGYPRLLFYLSGITAWHYFADCLTKTSSTFVSNANLFSKVYFPRLIAPLSVVASNIIRFMIQMLLLTVVIVYYNMIGLDITPNKYLLLFPALLIIMAGLGLGLGILISSMTTKYRDFQHLVGFGVSLLMYFSGVIIPLSSFTHPLFRKLILLNPMMPVVEAFRYAVLGSDQPFTLWGPLAYSAGFMIVVLLLALVMFNRVQRSFMDTV
jgi:lipopolysaccharide transport system permease protein